MRPYKAICHEIQCGCNSGERTRPRFDDWAAGDGQRRKVCNSSDREPSRDAGRFTTRRALSQIDLSLQTTPRHRVRPGRRIYKSRDVRDGGVATSQETLLISEARMAIGVALEKVAK